MPKASINGVELFYEISGVGDTPLVLVHGSWVSHHNWDFVAPALAESYTVLTYDRRGHSQSERQAGGDSMHDDVADLAALVEHLKLAPAWVAGNSFGASIALRLACERPELIRGLLAHEPPLFSLLALDTEAARMLEETKQRTEAVVDRINAGDHAGAAELFVETVALGPGAWAQLPRDFQQELIQNAATFLGEARDPSQVSIDLPRLAAFPRPVLLSKGDASPPPFPPVIDALAQVLPNVEAATFAGAGHIPHVTHPAEYVAAAKYFISKH